ncbi:MAG: penicillin acylase family protein [Deltaproteobacteria bacterium]|nr:penicillin acylase family protein [Deltaproteobacteria bacterium]
MFIALLSHLFRPLLRYWARKATATTRGAILVPALGDKVKVFWGPYAIPHLFAADEHDLFVAQGYLHAQERLWQMDINRRFVSGRLAEVLGKSPVPWRELSIRFQERTTVDLDFFIRLMGIRRAACASLKLLPEPLVNHLLAYSKGVNRYIETHLESLPLEFRLLRYEPEPWRPEDSLTIGKGFAFFLSTSLSTRLTWSALTDKLKDQEAKLRSLSPSYPTAEPSITRVVAKEAREISGFINGTFQQSDWPMGKQGSNNWVVAPWRSSTGNPILCNDPHLRMTLPSVWYLMHLKAGPTREEGDGMEVWGASIPGSPYMQLGHNRQIAWGVTAALCDDGELYRERIHSKEPDLYLAGEHWVKMEREEEKIAIRGGTEVKRPIRFTRHGPVISDFTQGKNGPAEEVLAFKWTAHEPSQELRCLYGVNRARNWNEFLESLSYQTAPTLNYVYADTDGNIGYSLAGKVPLRPYAPSLLPLPGWDGACEWQGCIPPGELPRLYNPPEGMIATANNRIADESYPYYLSDLFDPPYRIRRIRELLSAKEKFSVEDMADIQQDVVSVHARELIAVLKTELEQIARKGPPLKEVAEKLFQWDGDCSKSSLEATLFHAFHQRLMVNLLAPDLGQELYLAYIEIFNQSLVPIDRILGNPQSPWFASRPRGEMIEKSLRETRKELAGNLGADMQEWRWGKLHTLTLRHPFDRNKILAPLFSIGPLPSPGDGVTPNMGFYRHSNPYQYVVGPSLRMIVDLSNWRNSRFILPSGQSGHCFSPHYRDQTELWRRGEHIRLYHEEANIEDWPLLILTPAADRT